MATILSSEVLEREFKFGDIVLPDFDPTLAPKEIVKFYQNEYPELGTASIKSEFKGDKQVFNISTNIGTKG